MMTLNELWRIIQDIWATGNRWARWAISVIVGWPIALLAYALLNPSIGAASLMALIPVIALFMLVMTRVDPMVLAVLSAFKAGRTALKTISTVVGIELVIGVYCTLVRIGNDPELAMLLILFLVTYIFLAMGIKGNGLIWFAKFVCVMGMIALTAVFIFGGREKIGAEKANRYSAATIYQEIFPPPDLPGFWQDGLYVAPQKTKAVDGKKPNIISATKRAWGEQIAIQYNCDQDLVLTTLKGNETLTITHDTTKLLLKDQRCSYSMTGDNFPVYGIRNGKSLSQYENLMPFPALPPHAIVFTVEKVRKEGVKEILLTKYIEKEGGKIELYDPLPSGEEVEVNIAYNYPSDFKGPASQIGRGEYAAHFTGIKSNLGENPPEE